MVGTWWYWKWHWKILDCTLCLYILKNLRSGQVLPILNSLTHWQTLKDRAIQLLDGRNGALITQLKFVSQLYSYFFWHWSTNQIVLASLLGAAEKLENNFSWSRSNHEIITWWRSEYSPKFFSSDLDRFEDFGRDAGWAISTRQACSPLIQLFFGFASEWETRVVSLWAGGLEK